MKTIRDEEATSEGNGAFGFRTSSNKHVKIPQTLVWDSLFNFLKFKYYIPINRKRSMKSPILWNFLILEIQ